MKPKETETNSNGKITSLDFLKALTKNNPDMISEMIKVYLEETPELLTKMKDSIYKKDWEGIRAAAHSIIPSFSTMGISETFGTMAKDIQDLATKKENLEKIRDLHIQLETVCQKAYKELQEEMLALK